MCSPLLQVRLLKVVNRARAFQVRSSLDFEKLSGINRAGRRSKVAISESDRVFAIAGVKQREHLV